MERKKLWMIRVIAVVLAVAMVAALAMCTPLSRTLRATSNPDSTQEADLASQGETGPDSEALTRQILTCGREEHTHNEDCYDEAGNLTCGLEEHVHSEECYQAVEVTVPAPPETTELVLEENPEEPAPAASLWYAAAEEALAALPEETREDPAARLLAVAESQVGYHAAESSGGITENIYGGAGENWSTAFALWCLEKAGTKPAPEEPLQEDGTAPEPDTEAETPPEAAAWAEVLRQEGRYPVEAPQPGDVLFSDEDGDGLADRAGIVTAVQLGSIQVVEGGVERSVQSRQWSTEDPAILGYGSLVGEPETAEPETEAPATVETEPETETETETETPAAAEPAPEESPAPTVIFQEPEAPDASEGPEPEVSQAPEPAVSEEPGSAEEAPETPEESQEPETPEVPNLPAFSDEEIPATAAPEETTPQAQPWPAPVPSPAVSAEEPAPADTTPSVTVKPDPEEQAAEAEMQTAREGRSILSAVGSFFGRLFGTSENSAPAPDFRVSGGDYGCALPEEGVLLFRDLVTGLGLAEDDPATEADEVQVFLENIISVKTVSRAIHVRRVQADTTLGALTEGENLTVDYGPASRDEQAALSGTALQRADWLILRQAPFHSLEQLRVTMKNAEVFTVSLWDGQFHRRTLTAAGGDYRVTATFDDGAEIPEEAELRVTELSEASREYEEALAETIRTLSGEEGVAAVSQARVFDISLMTGGTELEPAAPVEVQVEYTDPVPVEEQSSLQVVHFTGEEPQVLDPDLGGTEEAEIESFAFTSDSFSTFAFVQAGYLGSLDGQAFAIVRDNGVNLVALCTPPHSVKGRLQATYVNVLSDGLLTAVTGSNGNTPGSAEIPAFTFHLVRDNVYYIQAEDGRYLSINGTALTLEDKPRGVEVLPMVVNGVPGAKLRLRDAVGQQHYLNLKGGNAVNGFQGSTSTDGNSTMILYAADTLHVFEPVMGRKFPASELGAGQKVIIYRRVLNPASGRYENYVIDGDGGLIYAYDRGDVITYRSGKSALWYVIEHTDENGDPNGYYDFFNPETGMYLAPRQDGTVGVSRVGVLLSGKASGTANSTIESWDSTAWAYCGLQVDVDAVELLPGTGPESEEFSFALPETPDPDAFHTVETVDSAAKGISIKMYDFPSRKAMNLFSDDTFYSMNCKQGLLQRRLGADGLPVSATGVPFSRIYNDANYVGDANHLFLSSIFAATGYYEYSSFRNYAAYDKATGDFTLYDEQGTPSNGVGGSASSYFRGNYLPYNRIDPTRKAINTVLYENGTDMMSPENPAFDSTLYITDTPDYFFGTIVEASFLQSKGGLDDYGDPIVYEFEGDDDLWVFLDGVLVLDIGGIHSALGGSIDFSTGEVKAAEIRTTIRDCFRAAGVFPDGSVWNDRLADNYFSGNTFNDYSGHQMKMFYQERGAGASTLTLRFNLPVVESGTFAVEKQLGATNQQNYSNVQFAYQAFYEDEAGQPQPLYPGVTLTEAGEADPVRTVYEASGNPVSFFDGAEIGGRTYDHVFYLRPGEAAVFSGIPKEVRYYVQEIDVSGAFYETVMINDADMGGEGGLNEDAFITAKSSSKTIMERQRVLFVNKCSPRNLRDLRITKEVENPIDDGAAFEFRVSLEGKNGEMTYYASGEYFLVRQIDGEDHYYQFQNGALTDTGTDPVVCSYSGAYGTIAGIPDGYTVVIKGLLAGTDFYVEEIRNPAGYSLQEKALTPDTYDEADLPGADGQIRLGKDAEMVIRNRRHSVIIARKLWENDATVAAHGPIHMALFRQEDGGLVPAETGAVLKSEPVRTIAWPDTTAFWNLELPEGAGLSDYTVLEVSLLPDAEGNTQVVPVGAGEMITLSGETTIKGKRESGSYLVSYETGEEELLSEAPEIRTRTDTITNSLIAGQKLSFRKVDVADRNSPLSGAVFDLYQVEDGTRTALFSGLVSGAEGYLALGDETVFTLPLGTFELVETAAPAGYILREEPVVITVTARDVSYTDGSSMAGSGAGILLSEDVYTLTVTNSAGISLPATGGPGTGSALSGLLPLLTALLALCLRALWRRRQATVKG